MSSVATSGHTTTTFCCLLQKFNERRSWQTKERLEEDNVTENEESGKIFQISANQNKEALKEKGSEFSSIFKTNKI